MTDRLAQARAEAERRWPGAWEDTSRVKAFTEGVVWADANPQPTTITRERFDAAEKRYWNYVHSNGDADLALLAAFHSAGIEVEDDDE